MSENFETIFEFCLKNDLKSIENFISKGGSINIQDKGNTLLHISSQNGFIDIVKFLINHQADLSIRNNGQTVIDIAKKFNQKEILKELLNKTLSNNLKK
ncbi:cyclin-dependent kinase inhibitor 2c [Anaeramoeba ignava]|uniref:Cyclin-dependent kinase inhibitor 2c n=1 Tax=Anaeramoeba ignava TaxID=1746090 RepID=A0A9Q0REZ4_ANAIG|nr:cyclin-dependent kinase inhibitor 2c [Anaeramoeba ignava]